MTNVNPAISASTLSGQVKAFLQTHPDTMICDFTVSRWGTVVLVHDGPDDVRILMLPLSIGMVGALAWGLPKKPGWDDAYSAYVNAAPSEKASKRVEWATATRDLLKALQEWLIGPTLDGLRPRLAGRHLLLVPGALAGLPLHAVRLGEDGKPWLFEAVTALAYVANVAVLPTQKHDWKPPAKALCVLSDPAETESVQLSYAPKEIAEVAERLAKLGAEVNVVASVGHDLGIAVFERRGLRLAPGVIDNE